MRIAFLGLAAMATFIQTDAVRTIDIKGLMLGDAKGDVEKPAIIANADELAKAIGDKDALAKIKGQVDFTKEKLVYFKWSGSGGDKLGFTTAKGAKELEVTVTYTGGLTRDFRPHHELIVMPKDAVWRLERAKTN